MNLSKKAAIEAAELETDEAINVVNPIM